MRRRTFCASALGGVAAAALPLRLLANDAPALTSSIEAISRIGKQLLLTPSMVTELRDALRGPLLMRSSAGYDSARRIWNGAFDKHPALIARCAGAADVIQCVQFARAHDLLVMQWGRETAKTVARFTQGYYANLSQETGRQRIRSNYGANLDRLVALKTKYDPLNLFHLNPNIEPRAASG